MHFDNIIKKFGKKNFDTEYASIVSLDDINNECSFVNSINRCLTVMKKLLQTMKKDKIIMVCTHAENLNLLGKYSVKKWDLQKDGSQLVTNDKYGNYCSCVEFGIKNKKTALLNIKNDSNMI